ncbi:hypothetical protein J6590_087382 [Homalodisca vitripennis]|nr:hypothetical protein J6590_087382 [Homalodisca vitripennis]
MVSSRHPASCLAQLASGHQPMAWCASVLLALAHDPRRRYISSFHRPEGRLVHYFILFLLIRGLKFDSLGWCAEVHLNTAGDDRREEGCCGRNKHFNCCIIDTRPHSYLTRRSTLTDTFVTYKKREPDLMTRPGKAAHIGPLVWLSLSSTSAPRTTLHADAAVHSFSALHPSSRGPDDGRGPPLKAAALGGCLVCLMATIDSPSVQVHCFTV